MMSLIALHKLSDVIFGITQKPLYFNPNKAGLLEGSFFWGDPFIFPEELISYQ